MNSLYAITLSSFVCALQVALDLGPWAFATLEIEDKKMNFDCVTVRAQQ